DLTAGYEFQNYLLTINNFNDLTYNNTIKTTPNFLVDKPESSIESFMGRLSINISNKYVLTGTIRQDASTKFNVNNRKAIFPSFALAWKINEESFLKNSNQISNLKLRIGYGVTGQQDGINNFDYLSFYSLATSTAAYQFGQQFIQGNRPGGYYYNRKWEQTTTKNVALDFGFLDNRISGTIEAYNRTTTDLLNDIGQPALTNFTNRIVANVGSMANEGIEFTLNLNPIRTKDWNWDLSFNAAYNKNTITKLTVFTDPNYLGLRYEGISGGVGNNILIQSVNYNRGSFFVFKQIYDATGNPIDGLFADLNRDGIINEKDLYQYKGIDPKWIFGFSSNLSYKKWAAGFVMRANLDNYVYNNVSSSTGTLRNLINPIGYINNGSNTYLQTGFSGSGSNYYFSDYYVENASFLRIDNINVSYNVGKIIQNKVNLTILANVQNVLVITKYKGLDPEINKGVDNNFYPRPRTFVLGLNFKF
ncbi:MAG: SusC/RagA family protein, partial [Sediminibacterium sp.]|nr:SusC/RagA family protein [Sediminibacterium sp.]